MDNETRHPLQGIAIIGMAGRFPGAKNIDEFWRNIRDGVESISFFTEEEAASAGIAPAVTKNPNYIRAGGVLENVELFDASFFGFTPKEAELMDPQQRLFLETAWEALEQAGYDAEQYEGTIGLYAGAGINYYILDNLYTGRDFLQSAEFFHTSILNEKDFLATRVSYKLNLKGPAVTVQTACSTSLVAIHQACRSLLNYECDMALAGGVRILLPEKKGYLYQEGMIFSPDGHCRAFDAQAGGTIRGNGVGIVVLKRLEDASVDGDFIHAVIKGSAINNDGAAKVGYTAPSVEGQAEVIAMAQAMAGVDPESISYIEAHGTATALGDPIEIAGLTQAFRAATQRKSFCAIGSVKTNIGHTDAAAGVAGLIKTVQALKHKLVPASLHFKMANPQIDFENSPFYVSTDLLEWKASEGPRRAGVSSFGIGGTNAHVVVEEAPIKRFSGQSRPCQLVVLSARTQEALEMASKNLAEHFQQHPTMNLADAAHTLHLGRRAFKHRRAVVSRNLQEAAAALGRCDPKRVFTSSVQQPNHQSIIFMFPGQGSQHVHMAAGLYQTEQVFRRQVDICSEILRPVLGLDVRDVLYPKDARDASSLLNHTTIAQPALFVVEYALANLWMHWGLKPGAMIGHSIGEYVAACVAGVLSAEDAATLVAERGKLMGKIPAGGMLAVSLSADELGPVLTEELSLAAVNGPSLCAIAGPNEAVHGLETKLTQTGVSCRRLKTSHAFHSAMMDPILEPFVALVQKIKLRPPQLPYISNVTGTWITKEQATDPAYWAQQLRQTVNFCQGMDELFRGPDGVFLEVGPSQALTALGRRHPASLDRLVVPSCRLAESSESDDELLLKTLGKLWLAGLRIDWSRFYGEEQRHRVPLPTYPFERQRFWIESANRPARDSIQSASERKSDVADWFYVPSWKRSAPLQISESNITRDHKLSWLVFVDNAELGMRMAQELTDRGQTVVTVQIGTHFHAIRENQYALNPAERADYESLVQELATLNTMPAKIVHLWSVNEDYPASPEQDELQKFQDLGCFSLIFLAQALGEQDITDAIQIYVVSKGLHEVTGGEPIRPVKATVLGPCKVIPQEYPNITCRSIDVGNVNETRVVDQLFNECARESSDMIVAFRGNYRWIQTFEPVRLTQAGGTSRLRQNGVYLITGGLGGIGLEIAEHLAKTLRPKLILTGRDRVPDREKWEELLCGDNKKVSRQIRKLQSMEALGAEILTFGADVASYADMEEGIARSRQRFGPVQGVIHCAGIADYGGIIQRRSRQSIEEILSPKQNGTLILDALLKDEKLDFVVLFSSVSSILYQGKFGQVGYVAGNEFLDAFAQRRAQQGRFVVSINWCDWREVGMSWDAVKRWSEIHGIAYDPSLHSDSLSVLEGVDVFNRILASPFSRVAVSPNDLPTLLKDSQRHFGPALRASLQRPAHKRTELGSNYTAANSQTEKILVRIWQELLGLEPIGIHDNFFELGGHSLIAAQLLSRVRGVFHVTLPVRAIFDRQTIAQLSDLVTEKASDAMSGEGLMNALRDIETLSDDEARRLLDVADT